MMSDNAAPTCKQGDGIGLVSGTNIRVSQTPCSGQWMAHWLKACRSSSSEDCQPHTDALRSGETSKVDRGKLKITENLSMRGNLDSTNDESSFSEKVSTQQLTESSMKWKNSGSYCCFSLDISKSDFEHFPMVDINRKIETILASKKKSAYGAVSVEMVKENLSLCELAPGSCLAAKEITADAEKAMTTYEGFQYDNAEDMDRRCKYQKTNMVACMFSSGLTYVCSCCFSSKLMRSGIESKPDGADVNHMPCKMLKCLKYDMCLPESCQNLKSADTGELFHKFSSTIKYSLVEDKVNKYLCPRERALGDSAFAQVNGSGSSKVITIPTKQNYGKKEKSTVPVENFVSGQDRNDWDDTSVKLTVEHNEFSSKVDTVCNHPFHRPSSLVGESFSMPQLGVAPSNLRNSKLASAPSQEVAGRSMETGMDKKREIEHPASTDKATYTSHEETSVSSTESSAPDHLVSSHAKISDISSPNPSETCSRWIKRFKDSHSETLSLCAKKFKKGDDSCSEKQQTLSRTLNYNPPSNGLSRFMEESETALPCGDSDESVQLWMRRWCRKDDEASRPSVPPAILPEELRAPLERFERTMPASIGAMALMGKAMNNYRSCRFRREDGSLVWNAEE